MNTPSTEPGNAQRFAGTALRLSAIVVVGAGLVMIAVGVLGALGGRTNVAAAIVSVIVGLMMCAVGADLVRRGPSANRAAGFGRPDTPTEATMRQGILGLSRVFPIMARILGAVAVVVGVALFVAGFAAADAGRPYDDGTTIQGIVVDNEITTIDIDSGNDGPRQTHLEVVAYEVDGVEYRVTRSSGRSEPWPLGTAYDVSYRASDPAGGRVLDSTAGVVLSIVGLAIAALGVLVFWGGPRYAGIVRRYHGADG